MTLLGPSGSGKTTVLNMIAGFEDVTAGRILLDGQDIAQHPPYKRNLGMVFQDYALFPHMTAAQNVAFPLQRRKIGREETARRVAEALEVVRLGSHGDRLPSQLSGGQQQRVALARAIVFRPGRCCSTSRWAPWTSGCATPCSSRSRGCIRNWGSPSSSSPTTRKRRWRSRTASRCSVTGASSRSAPRPSSTRHRLPILWRPFWAIRTCSLAPCAAECSTPAAPRCAVRDPTGPAH
ncbi:ABC transporter ATP-binding protein [Mycolicibacterium tokaiense]|uniref:ABC transporter ATP-binding protein n=1 Tax=Mycolicibacterium tokaiense TaxID=39695 RepID=UPI001EED38E9|nr:ATP-binding cassette domain-containing protein [Mycolicibacterium tokaiense]